MGWLIIILSQYCIHFLRHGRCKRGGTHHLLYWTPIFFLFWCALMAFHPVPEHYRNTETRHMVLLKYGFPDRIVKYHLLYLFLKVSFSPNRNKIQLHVFSFLLITMFCSYKQQKRCHTLLLEMTAVHKLSSYFHLCHLWYLLSCVDH